MDKDLACTRGKRGGGGTCTSGATQPDRPAAMMMPKSRTSSMTCFHNFLEERGFCEVDLDELDAFWSRCDS